MENVYSLKDFRDMKNGKSLKESVVIKMDNSFLVKSEVTVDQSLINSYVKKVKDESGTNVKERWSDEEIADKIATYIISSFVNIENLPTDMLTGGGVKAPVQTQAQAQMPVQEEGAQGQAQAPAQGQGQAQTPAQGQVQAQTPAQGQGQAQTPAAQAAAQVPAQEPKAGAQAI